MGRLELISTTRRMFDRSVKRSPIPDIAATGASFVDGQFEIVETEQGYHAINRDTGDVFPAELGQSALVVSGKVIFVSELE